LALASASTASISTADETYRFGVVPQFDARRIQAIWQPVLSAVEKHSGLRLELVGSPDIPQFENQLMAGEFDFAYMNPYHLIKAHTAQDYSPLVRDVGRTLYGIIVVRKDSPIQQIEDMDGKPVAFPAPNALGAALLPRAEFGEIYKINIQPRYVRSHSSVYLNVVTGQTVAGGGVQKTLQKQPANIRDALKVIYKTPQVAPHPVAVHPRVDKASEDKVRKAFLQLGNSPEGRELLANIPMKQVGRATLEDYEPLKQMGLDKYYVQ
jgi:phosphonate transport system substrate-binding protein